MEPTQFDIKKHIEEEHKRSPLSEYLKEIVYGGTDGIVTTFAVVAGFAGAQQSSATTLPFFIVLLFGFANLFADGISMGLGNFLSNRSEQDLYHDESQKELREMRKNPHMEQLETEEILVEKGFTREQSKQLVDIYRTNEPYWLNFMMTQELEMSDPTKDNPFYMAVATFLSFLFFGLIPLLPYVIVQSRDNLFLYSCIATAIALLILGILRWRVTNQSPLRSLGETLTVGGTSALIAYLVGTFFKI